VGLEGDLKMKKIEVETGQFYRVKIKNRDIYMGYWDIADDWSIERVK